MRERGEAQETGFLQDEWFTPEGRVEVNARLLGQGGPGALTHTGAGIAIGLQMAEARRDG